MIDIQKHKFILVQILKDIYFDQEISSLLGFKGGTAAYLFYNLPRFSVDLDFNLLDETKEDLISKKIEQILEKYGKIKQKQNKYFTLFLLLSYSEKVANVKIEISKRRFLENYEIKNYLGISMLVMKKEDILAHKFVTLLERKEIANRDLFDLWFFLKNNWSVNKDLVELRTKENLNNYLKKCIKVIEKVNDRYILQGLGEVLDEKQKCWVKEKLKQELLFLMKYYLKNY